jgi:hypothetical protein
MFRSRTRDYQAPKSKSGAGAEPVNLTAGPRGVPRSHRRQRSRARRFNPVGFSFALVGPRNLLPLPLRPLALRRGRFRRPGKSGSPPPFAPSLNVQGHDAHNDSGFSVILTFLIAKQLLGEVRTAVGTTVFRIRTELIFRRCGNLITPSVSCRKVPRQCRARRVSQGCGLVSADRPAPTTASNSRTHQWAS